MNIIKKGDNFFYQTRKGTYPIKNFEKTLYDQIKPESVPLSCIWDYFFKKEQIKNIKIYNNILPTFQNSEKEKKYYYDIINDEWREYQDDSTRDYMCHIIELRMKQHDEKLIR